MSSLKAFRLRAVLLVIVLSGVLAVGSGADTFTVEYPYDSDIRYCIQLANMYSGPDDIVFECSGTITIVGAPLPALTDAGTRILGNTAPDPGITLDCNGFDGLTIEGDDCEIYGLTIKNHLHGIQLLDGAQGNQIGKAGGEYHNHIRDGWIGILLHRPFGGSPVEENLIQNNSIRYNEGYGIRIDEGACRNEIGGDPLDGNWIAGNGTYGIYLSATMYPVEENFISNNRIGVNRLGLGAEPNAADGVHLTGPLCRLNEVEGNLISGNGFNGIGIHDCSENIIRENEIGIAGNGMYSLPNQYHGVHIYEEAHQNRLYDNVISGNAMNGVFIQGLGADHNVLIDNLIGVDPQGDSAIPNGQDGVQILDGPTSCTLQYNTISGNTACGIRIAGNQTVEHAILANKIGTDDAADYEIPNQEHGICFEQETKRNAVYENTISGNAGSGILIYGVGTTEHEIYVNLIGTDENGDFEIPNHEHGILFQEGTVDNVVYDNWVSGNGVCGIVIDGWGTDGHELRGNYVGTDLTGWDPISNGGTHDAGIDLRNGCRNCIIGPGNVVSGNSGHGIRIRDDFTANHEVFENVVGLNFAQSDALPNQNGIYVTEAAADNLIGPGNVVSGNTHAGVYVDLVSLGNTIFSNKIGTESSGTVAFPNFIGVLLASSETMVGGVQADGNLISGNSSCGIEVRGNTSWIEDNFIMGNTIGASAADDPLPNGASGIWLGNYVRETAIGDDSIHHANIIAYNEGEGVRVGEAHDPAVCQENRIGVNRIRENVGDGILFCDGTTLNRVVRASIFENGERGICVTDESILNVFRENSITRNGLEMIDLVDYGNELIPGPTIEAVTSTAATGYTNLLGAADSVDVFYDEEDEGRVYLGTCYVPAGTDTWGLTFRVTIPPDVYVTATNTGDWETGFQTSGASPPLYYAVQETDVPEDEEENDLPTAFDLTLTGSNPCFGGTKLCFAAPREAHLSLGVYEVGGRLVRVLADDAYAAGRHEIRWDGRDSSGRPASAGIYLMVARYDGELKLQRVTLLR